MTERLPVVTLYLSERCNSRCITCEYWRHGTRDMSLDAVRRMLPSLTTLRTQGILISGGEPLLNPEWAEIASLLRSRGFRLWLLTSGLSLAKHARNAAQLFDSLTVSLDGTCRDTYTAIRGVDAFDKVCEGILSAVAAGIPTSLRVTLQRANFRELPRFVALAHELGATRISFLAVDVGNPHAFARRDGPSHELALRDDEIGLLDSLIDELETDRAEDFRVGFISESPAKLRRIREYFSGLLGLGDFPPVRCNAPEFSAVVSAEGRVSPCFFIPGPDAAPRAPELHAAVGSESMRALRSAIRAGHRPECKRCVCSMWRSPEALDTVSFAL